MRTSQLGRLYLAAPSRARFVDTAGTASLCSAVKHLGGGVSQELAFAGLVFAGAAVCALAGFGGRLLLVWYLKEIRSAPMRQNPEDAIITYPLA